MRGLEAQYEAVLQASELADAILILIKDDIPYYKHTIFGKSETAKYFELFETDDSFERAFVHK